MWVRAELQPFVQQPEPVVSYSGIETRFDTLYVIDGTNSFVRYFSMSDPNISGVRLLSSHNSSFSHMTPCSPSYRSYCRAL
jgi:hypothetical protein